MVVVIFAVISVPDNLFLCIFLLFLSALRLYLELESRNREMRKMRWRMKKNIGMRIICIQLKVELKKGLTHHFVRKKIPKSVKTMRYSCELSVALPNHNKNDMQMNGIHTEPKELATKRRKERNITRAFQVPLEATEWMDLKKRIRDEKKSESQTLQTI